ncbi:MAG: PilX N-terminal domain-containing pilus assembly protein [Betaproteobacteria bacterium]|nr:PilX N-terminal domain-containing pilus assembly protein [Betaproteobacteria bacterium]
MIYHATASRSQHGAALIIAMILLVIMSLMAAASLRGTLMQERMSSNTYDYNLSFQAAEAGLRMGERQAENWVKGGASPDWASCESPNTDGLYQNTNPATCTQPLWEGPEPGSSGSFWHDANNETGDIRFNSAGLSLAPYYMVELVSENAPCQINNPDASSNCRRFRITASSRSTDGRSQVILQSIYATE